MAMRCVLPGSASVLAGSLPGSAGGSSGALQAPWGGGPPEEGAAAQAPRHSVLIVDVDGKSDSLLLHKVRGGTERRCALASRFWLRRGNARRAPEVTRRVAAP